MGMPAYEQRQLRAEFYSLAEFRDYLNTIAQDYDLSTVLTHQSEFIKFELITNTLSDNSEVIDFRITHV